jgi:hypothetical protein
MIAASSVGSIDVSTSVARCSGIAGSRTRSDAATPAASPPIVRSDVSSVYHAVGRVAAMRAASVDLPNPPVRALEQSLLQRRPGERPHWVGRRQQFRGAAARGARGVGGAVGLAQACLRRALTDGVRVGGHRVPCEHGNGKRRR